MVTDPARAELQPYLRDGRIIQIPRQRPKRLLLLDVLAQEFDPGVRYSEKQVNEILGRFHADTAALRRYMVDEEFLERDPTIDGNPYWRAGGTVQI